MGMVQEGINRIHFYFFKEKKINFLKIADVCTG